MDNSSSEYQRVFVSTELLLIPLIFFPRLTIELLIDFFVSSAKKILKSTRAQVLVPQGSFLFGRLSIGCFLLPALIYTHIHYRYSSNTSRR